MYEYCRELYRDYKEMDLSFETFLIGPLKQLRSRGPFMVSKRSLLRKGQRSCGSGHGPRDRGTILVSLFVLKYSLLFVSKYSLLFVFEENQK